MTSTTTRLDLLRILPSAASCRATQEIDQPFGEDANDLPVREMQKAAENCFPELVVFPISNGKKHHVYCSTYQQGKFYSIISIHIEMSPFHFLAKFVQTLCITDHHWSTSAKNTQVKRLDNQRCLCLDLLASILNLQQYVEYTIDTCIWLWHIIFVCWT